MEKLPEHQNKEAESRVENVLLYRFLVDEETNAVPTRTDPTTLRWTVLRLVRKLANGSDLVEFCS